MTSTHERRERGESGVLALESGGNVDWGNRYEFEAP